MLALCQQWLLANPIPDKNKLPPEALKAYYQSWYWVKATLGEALTGLGNDADAQTTLSEAYANAPATWMKGTTEEQLAKLGKLLENSPLQFLKT